MTEHEPTADVAVRASVIIPTREGRARLPHPLPAPQRHRQHFRRLAAQRRRPDRHDDV